MPALLAPVVAAIVLLLAHVPPAVSAAALLTGIGLAVAVALWRRDIPGEDDP